MAILATLLALTLFACEDKTGDVSSEISQAIPADPTPEQNTPTDQGQDDVPNWWGTFVGGDGFSIEITNFNGTSFRFAIHMTTTTQLTMVLEGTAPIEPGNDYMASYGEMVFELHPDCNTIDVFTPDGWEWEYLHGQYDRIN